MFFSRPITSRIVDRRRHLSTNHRVVRIILAAMLLIPLLPEIARCATAPEEDFFLSLSYHTRPIPAEEWSIVISRIKDTITIRLVNYKGVHRTAALARDEHVKLMGILTRAGIWQLPDYYQKNMGSGYYRIEVHSGPVTHRFMIEYGVPLTGNAFRYRQIIRHIINCAELKISE